VLLRKLMIVSLVATLCLSTVLAQEETAYEGDLDNTTTSQTYTIDLVAGQTVLVMTNATSGDLDTTLTLISPSGAVLLENDDLSSDTLNSAIGYTVEETGTYTVTVARYEGSSTSGAYTVTIKVGDEGILGVLDDLSRIQLSGPMLFRDTDHFRLHYTLDGDDAVSEGYINALALSVEEIWRIQIDRMGWPPPPSDNGRGGNDLYDVYMANLIGETESIFGYASPEDTIGDNANTPHIVEKGATSYIVLENDFELDYFDTHTVTSLMRTTMSHEFNHAIQFGYDTGSDDEMNWYFEATATWIETAALTKDEAATGYVEAVFKYPEVCFGSGNESADGLAVYGQWLFIQVLADYYGDEVVRFLWENIATYDGFEALERTLENYEITLPEMVAKYHVQNLARQYKLAPAFNTTVWLESGIEGIGRWRYTGNGIQELAANYFEMQLPVGMYYAGLVNDGGKMELWGIGIQGDKADAVWLGHGGTINTVDYDHYYLMVFNPVYDDNVDDCTYMDYSIDIATGKGDTLPVSFTLDATYFEVLR
jgi:hypothetical protein